MVRAYVLPDAPPIALKARVLSLVAVALKPNTPAELIASALANALAAVWPAPLPAVDASITTASPSPTAILKVLAGSASDVAIPVALAI